MTDDEHTSPTSRTDWLIANRDKLPAGIDPEAGQEQPAEEDDLADPFGGQIDWASTDKDRSNLED